MRYVFHCAGHITGAGAATSDPTAAFTANHVIHAQLLQAAHEAQVEKFLWLGSTTGYPPTGDRPVKEEEMLTGEPFEGYHFVGWEKRFMEILCRMYAERLAMPMTTLVLRPTHIYGPYDDFDPSTSRVTAALIRKVVERQQPLEVWGTGDDVRDIVYVDDVVEAMMLSMERLHAYTTLNIGSGESHSVKELLQTILELDGFSQAVVRFNTTKPSMIPIRLVDISKAKRVLGFAPHASLRGGLLNTMDWYRKSRSSAVF
jgi:GDP-L-fucose synthase